MNDRVATWHDEHANFAKLLNLLEAQLNLFHRGISPNYALMLDIMCYMTHYPDLLHHPREDCAFEIVKERTPKLASLVDELMAEHVVAVQSGERPHGWSTRAIRLLRYSPSGNAAPTGWSAPWKCRPTRACRWRSNY